MTKPHPHTPAYVSAKTLAHELDCAVSTVESYVKRGLLPAPGHLGDLVRWKWKDVEGHVDAILSGQDSEADDPDPTDPYMAGLANGTEAQAEH